MILNFVAKIKFIGAQLARKSQILSLYQSSLSELTPRMKGMEIVSAVGSELESSAQNGSGDDESASETNNEPSFMNPADPTSTEHDKETTGQDYSDITEVNNNGDEKSEDDDYDSIPECKKSDCSDLLTSNESTTLMTTTLATSSETNMQHSVNYQNNDAGSIKQQLNELMQTNPITPIGGASIQQQTQTPPLVYFKPRYPNNNIESGQQQTIQSQIQTQTHNQNQNENSMIPLNTNDIVVVDPTFEAGLGIGQHAFIVRQKQDGNSQQIGSSSSGSSIFSPSFYVCQIIIGLFIICALIWKIIIVRPCLDRQGESI